MKGPLRVLKETERAVVEGNFIRFWKVSAAGRPKWVRCNMNEMETSIQTKPEGYVVGKSTSENSSIMQHLLTPPSLQWIPPPAKQYLCEFSPPSLDEVCTAIRQLRNKRAPREDGIPVEIYKTCLDSLVSWLHRVFSRVRSSKTVPSN